MAFEHSQFAAKKDYCGDVLQYYKYFWNNAIPCDVVSPHSDLSKYKLVIVADEYMVDKETEENFKTYAFDAICNELEISSVLLSVRDLPFGVTAHVRRDGNTVFLGGSYTDMETSEVCSEAKLSRLGVKIYKK